MKIPATNGENRAKKHPDNEKQLDSTTKPDTTQKKKAGLFITSLVANSSDWPGIEVCHMHPE